MELITVAFEHKLVIIIKENQKITITPFPTKKPGSIKFGIEAVKGISVYREEAYKKKQEKLKIKQATDKSAWFKFPWLIRFFYRIFRRF